MAQAPAHAPLIIGGRRGSQADLGRASGLHLNRVAPRTFPSQHAKDTQHELLFTRQARHSWKLQRWYDPPHARSPICPADPSTQPRNAVEDPEISIRLKHGIHTIFLFAMLDWTFSRLNTELLSILRDRYPDGLSATLTQVEPTPLPADNVDIKIAYALPKNPNDLTQGWKNLNAQPTDTLAGKKLSDVCSVAFALLGPEADEAEAEFAVDVPVVEEEEEV